MPIEPIRDPCPWPDTPTRAELDDARAKPAPTRIVEGPPDGRDLLYANEHARGADPSEVIALLSWRPPWHADAACRETPDIDFYAERGADVRPAKAVCARCLVREECLAWALEQPERFGIWGGTSERERRQLRRQRAA